MASLTTTIACKTGAEFVERLMPTRSEWLRIPWFFRGHGDSTYELVPTIERNNRKTGRPNWEPYVIKGARKRLEDAYAGKTYVPYAVIADVWVTIQFTQAADRAGLPLPQSVNFLRDVVAEVGHDPEGFLRMQQVTPESVRERLPFTALAQHYGMPTRLLDWSRNSLAAGYFAVNQRLSAKSGEVCVWAFTPDLIHDMDGVDVVSLPSAGNPNMLHQSGLFTLVHHNVIEESDNPQMRRLDAAVESNFRARRWSESALVKITLPATEAAAAWRLFHVMGVGAAQLFPGHAGVAQRVRERAEAMEVLGCGIPE